MRFWHFALALPFLGGCGSGAVEPAATGEAKSAIKNPTHDLAYISDGDPRHTLDLYLPDSDKHPPLLIFIHGGAWMGGDKAQFDGLGERFSLEDGLAVAIVNYRLSPEVKNPEHVRDAAAAYRWLVMKAEQYGYDSKRIFVSGHSAGAHNAGMMATGDFLQKAGVDEAHLPAGFIGMEGIYDVPELNRSFPGYKDWFLTKALGAEAVWNEASPAHRPIVLHAPWLVIQSTQDQLVDGRQSIGFAAHLKADGVKVEFWNHPAGMHDEVVSQLSAKNDKVAAAILAFIKGQPLGKALETIR